MRYPAISSQSQPDNRIAIGRRNAYHQAGHAAAIYLGNKQKQLPVVFFQIVVTPNKQTGQSDERLPQSFSQYHVKVEGGQLIQSLPLQRAEEKPVFSLSQQAWYRRAFEADVINLLVGSLAEAKYVAERDGEIFNAQLIRMDALRFYGGSSDLSVINDYLAFFLPDKKKRDQKLSELFLSAYRFVNQPSHWNAINTLAAFILNTPAPDGFISCEAIMSVLEFHLAA